MSHSGYAGVISLPLVYHFVNPEAYFAFLFPAEIMHAFLVSFFRYSRITSTKSLSFFITTLRCTYICHVSRIKIVTQLKHCLFLANFTIELRTIKTTNNNKNSKIN